MDHVPGRRPTPGDPWRLTEADLALVAAKPKRARLEFAALLLFFRAHGRFPRTSAESAPTPWVRPIQIAFRVNIVSTSLSVLGKVWVNSRSPASQPSGMSAMRPPTRVRLVVSRAPVQASWRL